FEPDVRIAPLYCLSHSAWLAAGIPHTSRRFGSPTMNVRACNPQWGLSILLDSCVSGQYGIHLMVKSPDPTNGGHHGEQEGCDKHDEQDGRGSARLAGAWQGGKAASDPTVRQGAVRHRHVCRPLLELQGSYPQEAQKQGQTIGATGGSQVDG